MTRLEWTPELIDRFWQAFAQTRLTELSFARGAGPYLLSMFRDRLSTNGRILDFGGGDGHLAKILAAAGYPTAVWEPNEERRANVGRLLAGQDRFLGGVGIEDARDFDVVFCLEVIEHVLEAELPNFLERLFGALRPGGTLILSCPNSEDLDLDSCICPKCGSFFHRWQHLRSIKPDELCSMLIGAGFERDWLGLVGFNDPGAIAHWVRSREKAASHSILQRLCNRFRRHRQGPAGHAGSMGVDAAIGNQARILFVGRRPANGGVA